MSERSVQRILANDRNLVREATLIPSSVKPIANALMALPQFRSGNGQVRVSGTYTGTDDATYDVEIVDTIANLPIISKPTFKGSGNGTLSALSATGLAAQTITLTLGDIGLEELAAQTEFEGVTLRARTTGPAGNALRIHVDNSPLVFTDTQFSTIEDIKAGAGTDLKGAQFDWDTKVLGGKRAIPANAHRVAFGNDTNHIYLQWKEWKKDAWVYGFTPAITADVAKGTKVKFVTGGRTVTISDGTVTETYTNVVSIYDFLNAVKTTSALVEITGAVANDRAPGGQASVEFKLRTDAYAVANAGSNKLASGGFEAVTVGALANTEVIEARCIAANAKDRATAGVGSEIWALNGSVSGALGEIVSGSTYVEPSVPSKFALRVPRRVPDGFDKPRGKFSVTGIGYASRPGTTQPPDICVRSLALGPAAVDQQVTLTYTKRPTSTCNCEGLPFPDLSLNSYLTGLEGSTPVSDITVRQQAAYQWRRDFFSALYDGQPLFTATTAQISAQSIETDFSSILGLLKSLSGSDASNLSNWDILYADFTAQAANSLPAGASSSGGAATEQINIATTGFEFALANQNISSLVIKDSSPAPQTLVSATHYTADLFYGKVSFTNLSGFIAPFVATYSRSPGSSHNFITVEVSTLATGVPYDVPGINIANFRIINPLDQSVVSPANYSISAIDGTITFTALPSTLGSEAAIVRRVKTKMEAPSFNQSFALLPLLSPIPLFDTIDQLPLNSLKFYNENGTEITSQLLPLIDVAIPFFNRSVRFLSSANLSQYYGKTIYISYDLLDLPATSTVYLYYDYFTPQSNSSSNTNTVTLFMDAYNDRRLAWPAWRDDILAKAGKFDASTVLGDGSWRDFGDAYYWTVKGSVGGVYGSAFNNRSYVSTRLNSDSRSYNATREFAFQVNVAPACIGQLLPGDSVTLSIGDAAWPATYQVGDTLSLSIIAAQDLFLSGGQDGTNLQTWYINGSVDGPRSPYIYDPAAPAPYSASGLGFSLTPGTIPFAKSDEFKFTIEGGHYRWRKDGGAYSTNVSIDTALQPFTDGLTIQFLPGSAPSFSVGDLHKFRVLQPNRVANLRRPNFDQWAWDGASATLEIDFGAAELIDAIMLTYHTLPSAAALTIEFATTPGVYGAPINLTWQANVIGTLLDMPLSARYARLTISGAPFGRIGWLWLGSMLAAECCQGQVSIRYDYNIERAGLINGGAQAYGKTVSGEIKWDTGALTDTDRLNFVQMFDHVKLNHDQAVVIYPHYRHEDEAYLARILDDKIEIADWNLYHPNDKSNRALSVTLPFEGVIL